MEIKKATDSVKIDLPVQERELRCLKEHVVDTAEEVFSHAWVPGLMGGMGHHIVIAHIEDGASKKISKRGLELGIHRTKIETTSHNPQHKKH